MIIFLTFGTTGPLVLRLATTEVNPVRGPAHVGDPTEAGSGHSSSPGNLAAPRDVGTGEVPQAC